MSIESLEIDADSDENWQVIESGQGLWTVYGEAGLKTVKVRLKTSAGQYLYSHFDLEINVPVANGFNEIEVRERIR